MGKKGDTSPITGDRLVSKPNNKNYEDNYDKVFGKKEYSKEYYECLECNGTGYVEYPILKIDYITMDFTCPECNGTGKKK